MVRVGIDLTEFHLSVEWDLLEVPARRNVEIYPCCDEPYIDLTFNITIRRKMMFYTVNLIVPCVIICFLTVLVFYLPSDSGEKIALSINILVSLSWFFLLLDEIIPPTSLAIPLIGKYLLFTFLLVVTSVFLTVGVLSVHFKGSSSQKMPPWVHNMFLHVLPRILRIQRPAWDPRYVPLIKNREMFPALKNFELGMRYAYSASNVGMGQRVPDWSPVNIRRPLSDLDFPRQRRIFESETNLLGINYLLIDDLIDRVIDSLFIYFYFVDGISHGFDEIIADLNKRMSPEVLSAIESAEYLAQHISKQIDKNKVKLKTKFLLIN